MKSDRQKIKHYYAMLDRYAKYMNKVLSAMTAIHKELDRLENKQPDLKLISGGKKDGS